VIISVRSKSENLITRRHSSDSSLKTYLGNIDISKLRKTDRTQEFIACIFDIQMGGDREIYVCTLIL